MMEFKKMNYRLTKDRIIGFVSLLRGWNESYDGDKSIIESIMESDYIDFIIKTRELLHEGEINLKNEGGVWSIADGLPTWKSNLKFIYDDMLDKFKDSALKLLKTSDPKFELKPEDRFASEIYGKTQNYSLKLKKCISESLVALCINSSEFVSCSKYKPENTASVVIRDLLNNSDWKLWASVNELLPILAEAAPNEFLSSVENALKRLPCPYDELFKQEGLGGVAGTNYMTGLYWALETLAWNEDLLPRTILVLAELAIRDPGGNWANRPSNSISTILLPWMPQTMASVDKRIASLKGVQRNFPDIAWKILVGLLPNQHQVSSGSHKPSFQKYIPEDWKDKVSTSEYWEQVRSYAAMAVAMAKDNISYAAKLVENLDNIPRPSFDDFLEYLSSEEIIQLSDKQKQPLWETLNSFVKKHRRFSDAQWALPQDVVNSIEKVANKIVPKDPMILYRYLFGDRDFDFTEKDISWEEQQRILDDKRREAVYQIYSQGKLEKLIDFSQNVINPYNVGLTCGRFISDIDDIYVITTYISCENLFKNKFVNGFVVGRYYESKGEWLDSLKIIDITKSYLLDLFLMLPFEMKIWTNVEKYLDDESLYWRKVNSNPYPSDDDLIFAVAKLLKYKRPFFALNCISAYLFKNKKILKEQAIEALLAGAISDESPGSMDAYQITEIIGLLQVEKDISEDVIAQIEWIYLSLLSGYDTKIRPAILEKRLATIPSFFIEVIQLVYKSKKELDKEVEESKKQIATNAWKLLYHWKRPPVFQDDGEFSKEQLSKWHAEVKRVTIESGHYEIAMTHLGHVLFYSPPDPDGLWIHTAVAEFLDHKDNEDVRKGYKTQVFNSRGVFTVDPTGSPERDLAKTWRERVEVVEALGLIRFATSLRELADSYDRDAERVIADFSDEKQEEKEADD